MGHWGKMCLNPPGARNSRREHSATNVSSIEHDEEVSEQFEQMSFSVINIDAHSSNSDPRTEAFASIKIEPYQGRRTNLRGKVDTGAAGNIIPMRVYKQIYPSRTSDDGSPTHTKPSRATLTDYNGHVIEQYGTITMPCRYEDEWHEETFFIANVNGPVIFGLQTCTRLGLVKMQCEIKTEQQREQRPFSNLQELKQQYPEQFQGIGKFKKEYQLRLVENAKPVLHAPRKAPIQLREKIQEELKRMVDLDVIRPVNEPTDWVSSITYVTKADGSLRICLDPRDVNLALKRGQHHTPTIEELTHKFAGATVFSKLDAKSGYWAVPLDAESQLITTFNSPFGRYCFKRLPFGLRTSQDVFQHAMDEILFGLPGVVSIADDITVFGRDEREHDQHMRLLMERAKETGLVFNPAKCHLKSPEITFFGNIYSRNGVKPDPEKVQAILKLNQPTNKQELQTFLGMVTYLAAYIPHLSDCTNNIRKLLKKDVEFQWHDEHQQAFEKLKHLISNANALQYFDPKKPTIIQVDASQYALGAALIQENKVIAYASKSLTDAETRYANNERELLACVFGAEKFHTYVFGAPFVIESDHQPLEMITKKSLSAAPARLQRMMLRLQRYDYTVRYRPGRDMVLADSLSRLPTSIESPEISLNVKVCFIQFSDRKLQEIKEATDQDTTLHRLKEFVFQGFPAKQRELPSDLKPYWSFRDELSVENGVILKGEQIIIPTSLQQSYLEAIHMGHQGISRCQQRAKASIYWPGINDDIEQLIKRCLPCQTYQASQAKEPLESISAELPNIPWHTISTDLFSLDGKTYLIIADYYSKYPLVEALPTLSSKAVAEKTRKIVAMFGIPNTIISDNGPQFVGKEYQDLMREHAISHITSSPHHPQSHGFIERMIRTVKTLFRKANLDEALMSYRATPLGPNRPSPAQLMFNRKIQTNLPAHVRAHEQTRDPARMENNTPQQHGKHLQELHVNQPIFYQDVAKRTWSHGVVVGVGPEPRSYTIRCNTTGRALRRNRVLLRPRSIAFQEDNHVESYHTPSILEESPADNLDPPAPIQVPNPAHPKPPSAPTSPKATKTPTPIITTTKESSQSPVTVEPPAQDKQSPNPTRGSCTRSGRSVKKPQRLIESL